MHGHSQSHQHGSSTRAFATITLVNLAYTALEVANNSLCDRAKLPINNKMAGYTKALITRPRSALARSR